MATPKHRTGIPVQDTIFYALMRDPVIADAVEVVTRIIGAMFVPLVGVDAAAEFTDAMVDALRGRETSGGEA